MEEPVDGGKVGPTVRCLIIEQFRRMRDGDRWWVNLPLNLARSIEELFIDSGTSTRLPSTPASYPKYDSLLCLGSCATTATTCTRLPEMHSRPLWARRITSCAPRYQRWPCTHGLVRDPWTVFYVRNWMSCLLFRVQWRRQQSGVTESSGYKVGKLLGCEWAGRGCVHQSRRSGEKRGRGVGTPGQPKWLLRQM